MERGNYGEVVLSTLDADTRHSVEQLVKRAGERSDEHGSWDFGCQFDRKARGEALNWDLYGFGEDVHDGRFLIAIQVRQYRKQHKGWYPQIRKNYFLVGTNEDGAPFAHSIESRVVHSAIKSNRDVILAVQSWIFGADYSKVVRQGDLALVPARPPKRNDACPCQSRAASLGSTDSRGSHLLVADEIRMNGNMYALNPTLTHNPGTHPKVSASGWYKVVVGSRADFWKFAAPTID
jgi:hypothetical protein